MSAAAVETVRRFRDILALVSRERVRTAYEVAIKLKLPVSSTYIAVAELERLSCISRDEAGCLLVGVRPQQMALDAMGYRVRVQGLAPLVRYLRDQTGETVFIGNLAENLAVGAIAIGFSAGALNVEPFQKFRLVERAPRDLAAGVFRLAVESERDYGGESPSVALIAIALLTSRAASRPGVLIAGAARQTEFQDPEQVARKLVEAKEFFDRSQN